MQYDIDFAKKQVADLDKFRTIRALSGTTEEFKQVFQLLTLFIHFNNPNFPGYVKNAPAGIWQFEPTEYQNHYLNQYFPSKTFLQLDGFELRSFDAIYGVYVMGSIASVSQTSSSDLDIWVCHREDLNIQERQLLQQKADKLKLWAQQLEVEINIFLMEQDRFRSTAYAEKMTTENCGSAQYMLLLDEFYRSVIRLAGKPLLWLHLLVCNEKCYEQEVERLIREKQIDPTEWVDFGGLGAFSAKEYFGASLWHLYKGIDAPYKAAIKILLLEAYSWEYPNTNLIASDFKFHLLTNDTESHHFDPYLEMLDRVTAYLTYLKDFNRLELIRGCFYMKATEDLWYSAEPSWRFDLMAQLAKKWQWSDAKIDELNQRPFWKIKRVKKSYNELVRILMLSYRNVVNFARKYKIASSIMPQDLSILSRKLYTAFEELPGKVTLLNPQIANDLFEPNLTFIEVKKGSVMKSGWYVINQEPKATKLSPYRYVEYHPDLNKLVCWAYFNGLLTENTQLHIVSKNVSLAVLQAFATDLRLFFPIRPPKPTNDDLNHPCEIRQLAILVNLTADPTKNLKNLRSSIQQSDLFSFGPDEESLVGSIDLVYRNLWNEVRTFTFKGPNAILLALKVLSNKIHRGSASPQSINVFCYSQYYRRPLHNIVSALVQKCISIQMGENPASRTKNFLRVAGKNWQFFFEEKGISLKQVQEKIPQENELDEELHTQISDDAMSFDTPTIVECKTCNQQPKCQYPTEINAFASEGFLQFFFQDNVDGSFNVYILDEHNRIESYLNCDGEKQQKVNEINHIYAHSGDGDNAYHIVQRDFNYPQFYQLLNQNGMIQIVPFHSVN